MRRAAVCTVVVLAVFATFALSQPQPQPVPAADRPDPHLVRGVVAWRRAVWRTNRESFQIVIDELEKARAATAGTADFTTLYLLGFSYLRLGRVAEADPALADARKLAPSFPGLILTDALRMTALPFDTTDAAIAASNDALSKYEEYFTKLPEYPADGLFAVELKFLGHLFRGRTQARLPGSYDQAVKDLDEAVGIAKAAGEAPAAEVISLLAQMHQGLEQMEEAKKLVASALQREPGEPSHYYNMGLLLAGQHDDAGAKAWYEAAATRKPDFYEAHLKLAYLATKTSDVAALRSRLEAAAAILEARERAGTPMDKSARADIESGYGTYWMIVAEKRSDSGDDPSADEANRKARVHFLEALKYEKGCVGALNRLIQVAVRLHVPDEELAEYKRRLEEINRRGGDAHRSTFC